MSITVYVPRDSAALAVGADRVARRIAEAIGSGVVLTAIAISLFALAVGHWLGGVSGRLYLQGTPVLDMANARLSFTNLRYTVATQSMLTRSASCSSRSGKARPSREAWASGYSS